METKSDSPIIIKNYAGLFQLLDDDHHTLETKAAQRGLSIFEPYFEDPEQQTFKEDFTYVQLLELVKKLNRRLQHKGLPEVRTSSKFDQFVQQCPVLYQRTKVTVFYDGYVTDTELANATRSAAALSKDNYIVLVDKGRKIKIFNYVQFAQWKRANKNDIHTDQPKLNSAIYHKVPLKSGIMASS